MLKVMIFCVLKLNVVLPIGNNVVNMYKLVFNGFPVEFDIKKKHFYY